MGSRCPQKDDSQREPDAIERNKVALMERLMIKQLTYLYIYLSVYIHTNTYLSCFLF